MKLLELLAQKQAPIVEKWLFFLFDSYPPETSAFLKTKKDRFDNPVAYQLSEGVLKLYEAFTQEQPLDDINACLDAIISVKAIQDARPSQALAFVFQLKHIIREELAAELWEDPQLLADLVELEARIDGLGLMGFDVYMGRREKLCEIRVDEVKNRIGAVLRRSGLNLINP